MSRLPYLASRIYDRPLIIAPRKLEAILSALGPRLEGLPAMRVDEATGGEASRGLGFHLVNGVAVIEVQGTLVQRSGYLDAMSGLTSYMALSVALSTALADDRVQSLVFDIDSPGGEVPGCFDLVDEIYAARGRKPMLAVANEVACSAAYAIASAADRVVLPRTGEVGSIGVVWTHVDLSGANEKAGVAVTHIHAGDRKVDGTPFAPLPDDVRDRFQAEIDKTYAIFVKTVARNRSLAEDAVRATEAGVYSGSDAVALGLADRVCTFRESFAGLPGIEAPGVSADERRRIAAKAEADERAARWAAQAEDASRRAFETRLAGNPALAQILGR